MSASKPLRWNPLAPPVAASTSGGLGTRTRDVPNFAAPIAFSTRVAAAAAVVEGGKVATTRRHVRVLGALSGLYTRISNQSMQSDADTYDVALLATIVTENTYERQDRSTRIGVPSRGAGLWAVGGVMANQEDGLTLCNTMELPEHASRVRAHRTTIKKCELTATTVEASVRGHLCREVLGRLLYQDNVTP